MHLLCRRMGGKVAWSLIGGRDSEAFAVLRQDSALAAQLPI